MIDVAGGLMAQGRDVAVARVQGTDDNMTRPHCHEYVELYLLEEGQREHWSDGTLYGLHAPQIITFPPHNEHYSRSMPGQSFRRVVVYARAGAVLYEHVRQAFSEQIRVFRPAGPGLSLIRAIVEELLHVQNEQGARSQEEMALLLTRLLLVLDRQDQDAAGAVPTDESLAVRLLRHLHAHYMEPVSLDSLAQQFYVSRSHLSREFKRHTGATVVEYVNDLRVDQARRLLHETTMPISRIALDVGFSTVTHFNRVFRDRAGTTPRQLRRQPPHT